MNHKANVKYLVEESEKQIKMKLEEPMRTLFMEILSNYGKHCFEKGMSFALGEKSE